MLQQGLFQFPLGSTAVSSTGLATTIAGIKPAQLRRVVEKKSSRRDLLGSHDFFFETRRCDDAANSPPRTVGLTSMIADNECMKWIGSKEAVDVLLRSPLQKQSAEAAKEKVAFCNPRGDMRIFQADSRNQTAELCACGNATGAAAAMFAAHKKRSRVHQYLKLPDGAVELNARVTNKANGGWEVEQSWCGIRFDAFATSLAGRDVVVCTGDFNDYLLVRLADKAEIETFSLDEVLHLWDEAKQFSGFESPLRSRLVAIAPDESIPFAKFYTCGRMHPGAPLTGLATLAMSVNKAEWLKPVAESGRIAHRRGIDDLPGVHATSVGIEIRFPNIHVALRHV